MSRLAYHGKKKLKKKAVKRAKQHEGLGSYKQRNYGEFEVIAPGTAEFRGCAVACLVQPTKYALISNGFKRNWEAEAWAFNNNIPIGAKADNENDDTYRQLREKFNFSDSLCFVIEGIFETLIPNEAQYWPRKVVSAIPVGADVSDDVIQDIIEYDRDLQIALGYAMDTIGGCDRIPGIAYCQDVYNENYDPSDDLDISAVAEEFLWAISNLK